MHVLFVVFCFLYFEVGMIILDVSNGFGDNIHVYARILFTGVQFHVLFELCQYAKFVMRVIDERFP